MHAVTRSSVRTILTAKMHTRPHVVGDYTVSVACWDFRESCPTHASSCYMYDSKCQRVKYSVLCFAAEPVCMVVIFSVHLSFPKHHREGFFVGERKAGTSETVR